MYLTCSWNSTYSLLSILWNKRLDWSKNQRVTSNVRVTSRKLTKLHSSFQYQGKRNHKIWESNKHKGKKWFEVCCTRVCIHFSLINILMYHLWAENLFWSKFWVMMAWWLNTQLASLGLGDLRVWLLLYEYHCCVQWYTAFGESLALPVLASERLDITPCSGISHM